MFRTMLVNRFAFDVELLTIVTYLYFTVKEMPIAVRCDHTLRVHNIERMLLDVIAISYR
jgi:hypothetical protein